MKNFWGHLCTVLAHKYLVMKYCFCLHLYWQGLCHDMSKFSLIEFGAGVHYFQGNCSPNNAQRQENGYSTAWMHHQGRNKHHYEYWVDYSLEKKGQKVPVEMPRKYVAEMFCDRVAACRIYQKKEYTNRSPLEYYRRGNNHKWMHPVTAETLEFFLETLAQKGEKKTFVMIRSYLKDAELEERIRQGAIRKQLK